ncbi:hypothetical protein [Limoniibacter endophyticus]|uniref:hypothetical protein n=1 Tax=Limoniibacter endophyticus TaxID=1565040 RepID=UPI001671DE9A|nr:hypothetical protein [Limoniibacter endophyticus]
MGTESGMTIAFHVNENAGRDFHYTGDVRAKFSVAIKPPPFVKVLFKSTKQGFAVDGGETDSQKKSTWRSLQPPRQGSSSG